jgi:hypothetical protein
MCYIEKNYIKDHEINLKCFKLYIKINLIEPQIIRANNNIVYNKISRIDGRVKLNKNTGEILIDHTGIFLIMYKINEIDDDLMQVGLYLNNKIIHFSVNEFNKKNIMDMCIVEIKPYDLDENNNATIKIINSSDNDINIDIAELICVEVIVIK